jgi:hypothetical protein
MRMATDLKPPLLPNLPITEDYAKLLLAEMKRAENHLGLYRAALQPKEVQAAEFASASS